eukprot:gb/GFBE01080240.1/.p1 GENE.gb/GFBE01080240.1/~~gb/GFBE01080240.1/.p1  ORF type:complete len:625 (+),score=114.11 gb/GFBE01080240.1/:1-1875(+)
MELALVTRGKASRCFEPSDSFVGARPGWCFKLGDRGLGYYLDGSDDVLESHFRKNKQESSFLFELAERGKFSRLKGLLGDYPQLWQATEEDGTSLLHWAALKGDATFLESALSAGCLAVDALGPSGQTPLMWACAGGSVAAMHVLLSAGAQTCAKDSLGATPLIHAVQHEQHTALLRIVATGATDADVEKLVSAMDSKGRTAVHWAAFLGDLGSLKLLSHLGANLFHLDERRNTLLHQAVAGSRPGVIEYLLERGVDPELHNADGATCVDVARDGADKKTTGKLEQLLKPKGIDVHDLAEKGSAPFEKQQQKLDPSKDPMQLLKQYGMGMLWLMCVAITTFEYLLDSRALAWELAPWAALAFELSVLASLSLYFYVALADPGKVPMPPRKKSPGLDACIGLLRAGKTVEASRVCTTTWLLKDLRTKYDIWSGTCIQEFDHFCNFTGCVIGRHNHRPFFLLCLMEPIAQCWFLFVCVIVAYRPVGFWSEGFTLATLWETSFSELFWLPLAMVKYVPSAAWNYPLMALVSILHVVTCPGVIFLLYGQCYLIGRNWTVNEDHNKDRYSHLWTTDAFGNRMVCSPFSKGSFLDNWKDFWWHRRRSEVGPDCPAQIRALAMALKEAGAQ